MALIAHLIMCRSPTGRVRHVKRFRLPTAPMSGGRGGERTLYEGELGIIDIEQQAS